MPVMPAPTTRTSTSPADCAFSMRLPVETAAGLQCTDRLVYRPAVPFEMKHADRAPKERYFDPEFYRLETERLWSRTWQMGCRLEEIPQAHDFTEYEILDQPIVIVRTEDGEARAFQNACRHRGVKIAE